MLEHSELKPHHKIHQRLLPFLSLLAGILIGALLVIFVQKIFFPQKTGTLAAITVSEMRKTNGYQFINPLLECEIISEIPNKTIDTLKRKLTAFIERKINAGIASHISVYFRDLNNGPWLGIKEKESFTPASLLKVPLMMAYFKLAESDPSVLTKVIQYETDSKLPKENIRSAKEIELGEYYTVENLIYRMLVYSDNAAANLLLSNIGRDSLDKIYDDLGITTSLSEQEGDSMSVKEYASFFRILYNASYLNRAYSEKALEILSKVEFKDGLAGGISKGTPIAHKFGERRVGESETKQLHDCGIIYYRGQPYLLCVMTRGEDFKQLITLTREISEIVYQEISRTVNH